jgi:hypothetical protein
MVRTRPRTLRKKRLKARRCLKCRKLVPTYAKRCKTCHALLPKV